MFETREVVNDEIDDLRKEIEARSFIPEKLEEEDYFFVTGSIFIELKKLNNAQSIVNK